MCDFICEYILPVLAIILIILAIVIISVIAISIYRTDILKQDDYIQNLEEKLNIYERSYDEFCLEDSLRQSDANERI